MSVPGSKKLLFFALIIAAALLECRAAEAQIVAHMPGQAPENLAFDSKDNVYVTSVSTSKVFVLRSKKVGVYSKPQLVVSIPTSEGCSATDLNGVAGIAISNDDIPYISSIACKPELRGILALNVTAKTYAVVATVPLSAGLNGITIFGDYVYAADMFGGAIWKIGPLTGVATSTIWIQDALLAFTPAAIFLPGANGIKYFGGKFYVSNSEKGIIATIPIDAAGNPGTPSIFATLPDSSNPAVPTEFIRIRPDDLAIDVVGSVYVATNPYQSVIKIDQDGTVIEILGLTSGFVDGPTALAFGRVRCNRLWLYISNGALTAYDSIFPTPSGHPDPFLSRVAVDIPGALVTN